jgi:terpene synthase-like protein
VTAFDAALAQIYCPIEHAINPAVDRVQARAGDWLDEFGFCADRRERACVIGSNSADFYARFAPAADEDRLLAAVLWVYWGFAFDDAFCDDGPVSDAPGEFAAIAATVQRALEVPTPMRPQDPVLRRYCAALQDIASRLRDLGTPTQFQRFVVAHQAWLAGVMVQVGNRGRGHMPDMSDYLTMRLHSAGGEPTFAMLEIANGCEIPASEMDSAEVCAATEMAIMVAALDNDRLSLAKELARRHTEQNVFNVLTNQGYPLDEAIEHAVALRDRVLCRFLRLREWLLPRASEALHTYLDGLRHGIRGNAEWGLRVPRYVSHGELPGPIAEIDIRWADHPADEHDQAPNIPAISWWWEVGPGPRP